MNITLCGTTLKLRMVNSIPQLGMPWSFMAIGVAANLTHFDTSLRIDLKKKEQ